MITRTYPSIREQGSRLYTRSAAASICIFSCESGNTDNVQARLTALHAVVVRQDTTATPRCCGASLSTRQMKKRAGSFGRCPPAYSAIYLIGKIPGSACVPSTLTPSRLCASSPRASRMVGATCAVCTGVVKVLGESCGFDTKTMTLVSS